MSSLVDPSTMVASASLVTSFINHNRSKNKLPLINESEQAAINGDVYTLPFHLFGLEGFVKSVSTSLDSTNVGPVSKTPGSQFTCLTCHLNFTEHSQQQEHFKSDWHIANIKRKMRGEIALSESEFLSTTASSQKEVLITNIDTDNDDGSESSDSDTLEDNKSARASKGAILDEEILSAEEEANDSSLRKVFADANGYVRKVYSHSTGPQFVVEPSSIAPYRFLFSTAILRADSRLAQRDWSYSDNIWGDIHTSLSYVRSKPYMAVIVLRSGRFAGAIFNNQNSRNPLVLHKVIRRYTVRAKAGGGQSSHDNKHGKAKSMGAQLRRYGEQMLQEDIERLLTAWVDYLAQCSIILVAATKTMRGNLFDKEDITGANNSVNKKVQLLQKNDPRVVFVPFAVDKPTLETARLIRERAMSVTFTSLPMSHDTVLASATEAVEPVMTVTQDMAASSTLKTINEEAARAEAVLLSNPIARRLLLACQQDTDEVAASCLRSIAHELGVDLVTPAVKSEKIASKESENSDSDSENEESLLLLQDQLTISRQVSTASVDDVADVLRLPNNLQDLSTALHLASERNLLRTARLLFQLGANPEQLDARGRTPYFLAKTKEMRELFRRMRGELGENRWQWNRTGIPEAITEEKIAQQKLKEKEKKKRAQQRKKEQKEKMEQQAKDAEIARQLQAEFRRQEHEERAEQQKKAAGVCVGCQKSLFGQDFFEVFDQRCCSTLCVQKVKRKLAADAALARFGQSK